MKIRQFSRVSTKTLSVTDKFLLDGVSSPEKNGTKISNFGSVVGLKGHIL